MAYTIKDSTARLVELTELDARKQIDSSDADRFMTLAKTLFIPLKRNDRW